MFTCCYWSMHAINILLPWLASWTCDLAVAMLFVMQSFAVSDLSSQGCLHNSVYAMLCFSAMSETVNNTWYVYMAAIISSVPFWLMISKGLLIYAFSRFMPCLCLIWYVLVECCLLALNSASWCCFWHVSIFTKSVMLISFALLPCLFEPALVWFSRSSVFIFCQASCVHHCHMLCCYVGVK